MTQHTLGVTHQGPSLKSVLESHCSTNWVLPCFMSQRIPIERVPPACSSCTACVLPVNLWHAVTAVCLPGREGSSCTACAQGSYSPGGTASSSLTCTPCPTGYTTAGTGATAAGNCSCEIPNKAVSSMNFSMARIVVPGALDDRTLSEKPSATLCCSKGLMLLQTVLQ